MLIGFLPTPRPPCPDSAPKNIFPVLGVQVDFANNIDLPMSLTIFSPLGSIGLELHNSASSHARCLA